MQLKLDVKTLVIGIVLGVILTVAIGAGVGSADAARFGIAMQNQGFALVQTSDGSFYVVDPERATAERVVDKSRGSGRAFSLSSSSRPRRGSEKD